MTIVHWRIASVSKGRGVTGVGAGFSIAEPDYGMKEGYRHQRGYESKGAGKVII